MSTAPYTLQFCVDEHLRNLSRMLACLDRVGKDLYLEANEGQVSLRTLNAAQSAFVKFCLRPDFFSEFVSVPDASLSIKLFLKNVVSIFRSVQGVSKVWVQIASGADENYMRVQQECSNGLRKKFDLAYEEVTMINAVYSHDSCLRAVTASPSTMLSCLSNFPPLLAEVTLVMNPDSLTLRNDPESLGLDDQADVGIRTEMSIAAANLHAYEPGPPSTLPRGGVAVTFSLREFKALLNLSKDLEHRIRLQIEAAGQPILVTSEAQNQQLPPSFTVESVLATVVESVDLDEDMDDVFGDANDHNTAASPPSSPSHSCGQATRNGPHQYSHTCDATRQSHGYAMPQDTEKARSTSQHIGAHQQHGGASCNSALYHQHSNGTPRGVAQDDSGVMRDSSRHQFGLHQSDSIRSFQATTSETRSAISCSSARPSMLRCGDGDTWQTTPTFHALPRMQHDRMLAEQRHAQPDGQCPERSYEVPESLQSGRHRPTSDVPSRTWQQRRTNEGRTTSPVSKDCDSDTEEEEDAVPGTPPGDDELHDYRNSNEGQNGRILPNKRPCINGCGDWH